MRWQASADAVFDRFDVSAPAEVSDMVMIAGELRLALPGASVEVYHTYTQVHARISSGGEVWRRSKEVR